MNVSLNPQLEKLIEEKVASGMYNSASEVIREGLRLLQEKEQLREIRLEELRKQVQVGLNELDNGQSAPLNVEDIKRRGRERLAQKEKKK